MLDGGDHRAEPDIGQRLAQHEQRKRDGRAAAVDSGGIDRHGHDEGDRRQPRVAGLVLGARTVAQPAAEQHAGDPANEQDAAVKLRSLDKIEPEAALQQLRQPEGDAVSQHRTRRGAERQQPEARLGFQTLPNFTHRRRRRRVQQARRIAHQPAEERRERQPRQSHRDERAAPTEACRHQPAEQHARRRPERNAERKDRQRPRPPCGRKAVGDQRIGWRHAAGLADADTQPAKKQLPEVRRCSAQGGEAAPERQADGDGAAAALAIREDRDRNGDAAVEQCEGDAAEQPELRVA